MTRLLEHINAKIQERATEVENWLKESSSSIQGGLPVYTSVDLRISDYKIAPVDTNIFPSGFNNLCPASAERVARLLKSYFENKYPWVKKILIIPENHTRNRLYWESIYILKTILEVVDFWVEIGLISDDLYRDKIEIKTGNNDRMRALKVKRNRDLVFVSNFIPDLILLNNDLSSGLPKMLYGISQPVEPPIEIGWHTRRKSLHFDFYNGLAAQLADILGIDPLILTVKTVSKRGVDFDNPDDVETLAQVVDDFISQLREDYAKREIPQESFAFIKNDFGTYGMGIINVTSGDELKKLSRRSRSKRQVKVSKGRSSIRDFIIQEGIPTAVKYKYDAVAEPVIYLVGESPVGGFLRISSSRGEFDNLNTKGADFRWLCLEKEDVPSRCNKEGCFPLAYQIIARTAAVAAGYEIKRILSEKNLQDSSIPYYPNYPTERDPKHLVA